MIDAFSDIRSWLNGKRDYAAGVRLYRAYGDIESLKVMFATAATAELQQKLFDRLKEIYSRIKAKRDPEGPALISAAAVTPRQAENVLAETIEELKDDLETTGASLIDQLEDRAAELLEQLEESADKNIPEQNISSDPKHVRSTFAWQELDKKKSRLYNEMVMHFNQLDLLKDESPECRDACLNILELEDDYENVRVQMKYFEEHGELPAAPVPISSEEENSARKKLAQLRPNITKAKKLIPILPEGKRLNNKKKKLEEWEREVSEIEKLLGIEKRIV